MARHKLLPLYVLAVISSLTFEVSALARHALMISPSAAFKGGRTRNAQEAYRVGSKGADCDTSAFTVPTPVTGAGTPQWPHTATTQDSSYSWRIRIQQPCRAVVNTVANDNQQQSFEWDLYGAQFFGDSCANATTPLQPDQVMASGDSNIQFNKELALDDDPTTKAQLDADDVDQVWFGIRFDTSTHVKCVKFIQCDCLRSARAVALEFMDDTTSEANWVPLKTKLNLVWGMESSLEVDE